MIETSSLRAVLSLDKGQLRKELARAGRELIAWFEFLKTNPTPQEYDRWHRRMRYCRGHRKPKRPLPDWLKPGAPMPPKGK